MNLIGGFMKKITVALFFSALFLLSYKIYSDEPYILVSHGLGSNAQRVIKEGYSYYSLCPLPYPAIENNIVEQYRAPIGQGRDIKRLHEMVQNEIGEEPFVGVGRSRGGAALISFVSKYNPKNLKALVTCGAPSSMPREIGDQIGGFSGSQYIGKAVLVACSHYPLKDITPNQGVKNITNKDLLVVLIHHENDELVHIDHGKRLYDEFKQRGFRNLYWIPIKKGLHNNNIWQRARYAEGKKVLEQENEEYRVLQSIYKNHGLAYDSEFADISEADLKQYQPTDTLYRHSYVHDGKVVLLAIGAGLAYYAWKKYKARQCKQEDIAAAHKKVIDSAMSAQG